MADPEMDLKLSVLQPLISSSSPSCIESGDYKFTAEKKFAEQIAPEIINFLFLSPNCIFNQVVK
jgi:hypothetical protein